MLGQHHIRRPPKRFNLIYLQSNEVHLMSLKSSLLIDPSNEEIQGKLHLCTRSIFFQPNSLDKPLLRLKYSCGVFLRMLKNIENKKIHKLIFLSKSQNDIKTMLSKGPSFITDVLEQQQTNKKSGQQKKTGTILSKVFDPEKRKKIDAQQKIGNYFFIKVPKIFIIYRRPISPYITQKIEENIVIYLDKSNPKNKILRFLKLYDEITKAIDEAKLTKCLVNAAFEEYASEQLEKYRHQKLEMNHIFKCKRLNIEGHSYGQLLLLKSKFKYIPFLNSPDEEQLEFTYREIKYLQRYLRLFQDNAIQLWMYKYPYSILLIFQDNLSRQHVYNHLKTHGQKILKLDLSDIVNRWSDGQISNVEYLNYLNIISSRSFNDLSQYPVFPWIINSYQQNFDLKNVDLYRNLGKPIGAINKHRLKKLKDLYQIQVRDKTSSHPPHLYPTHYSTPAYVSYYLMRKIPQFIVRLQNGIFSPSDRVFRCVQSAYYATMNNAADFKQLIPEFYSTDCDFLVNSQKLELGSTPQGELIDDVILPKWATNAQDYLLKMRAAFEADYVSSHINQWIDLIFGYKQSGTSAITSDNLFYYLTYMDNVDLKKQMTRIEKDALTVQVSEFGQVPFQLFYQRHPVKKTRILSLDVGQPSQDKKVMIAKMQALGEQNERLHDEIERQRYRFNKKLNEKQETLMRNQKQKKKQINKIKQILLIDENSLKKFQFRSKFQNENDKDTYMRQLQQIMKEKTRQNSEMQVIIAGLKKQVQDEEQSVDSNIGEGIQIDEDFLDEKI